MAICRKKKGLQVAILQEHEPKFKHIVLKLLRSPMVFTLTSMCTRASSISADVFGLWFLPNNYGMQFGKCGDYKF
jgi:hypothetical protein